MSKKILIHSCCGPCSIMPLEYLLEKNFSPTIFYYNPNIHLQKEYNLRLASMQHVAKNYALPLIIGSNNNFIEEQKNLTIQKELIKEKMQIPFSSDELMKKAINKILTKWKIYAETFQEPEYEKLYIFAQNTYKTFSYSDAKALLLIDAFAFIRHLTHYDEKERCKQCYKERMMKSLLFAKEQGFNTFTTTLLYSKYQCHEDICFAIEKALQKVNSSIENNPITFHYTDFREFWHQGIDKSKELNLYRQKWCGCVLSRLESLQHMATREYEKLKKKYHHTN